MIQSRNSLSPRTVFVLVAFVCVRVAFAFSLQHGKTAPVPGPSPAPAPLAEQSTMVAPSIARPRPEYQFPVGQTFVYGAEWRVFNAGIATLRLEQAGQEHRVVATADAAGTISLLYHVQDKLESFLDPASFCSHNTSRHLEEGFRNVETNITFDYQHRQSDI